VLLEANVREEESEARGLIKKGLKQY